MAEEPPRMPSKEEIEQKALEIYYRDHPEAIEHKLTPDVEKELRPPEGYYYLRAQRELMSSYRGDMEQALRIYEEEVQKLRETLGIKPPENLEELQRRVELLEMKVSRAESEKRKAEQQLETTRESLSRREADLAKAEEALKEKREIEKKYTYKMVTIKLVQHVSAFIGQDGKSYGPYYGQQVVSVPEENAQTLIKHGVAQPWAISVMAPLPVAKESLRKEAEEVWEEYKHAVLGYDTAKAQKSLERLKAIRIQLLK
jgi:hypothetical protein